MRKVYIVLQRHMYETLLEISVPLQFKSRTSGNMGVCFMTYNMLQKRNVIL